MQEYKAYFVTHYLKPLLQAAEVNVKDASYREEDDRELVRAYVHRRKHRRYKRIVG